MRQKFSDKHSQAVAHCIGALIHSDSYRAIAYKSPTEVVKVTRKKYGYRKSGYTYSDGNLEFSVIIGKPGYLERQFIKLCKKAKEPFPVAKIQLKALPVRRA